MVEWPHSLWKSKLSSLCPERVLSCLLIPWEPAVRPFLLHLPGLTKLSSFPFQPPHNCSYPGSETPLGSTWEVAQQRTPLCIPFGVPKALIATTLLTWEGLMHIKQEIAQTLGSQEAELKSKLRPCMESGITEAVLGKEIYSGLLPGLFKMANCTTTDSGSKASEASFGANGRHPWINFWKDQ